MQNTTFDLLKRQAEKNAVCAEMLCIFAARATLKRLAEVAKEREVSVFYGLRASLEEDIQTRLQTIFCGRRAYGTAYNKDGKRKRITIDANAEEGIKQASKKNLSDAYSLVNDAYVVYLQEKKEHGGADNWLDTPYTEKVLDKRVIINRADSAAYKEVIVTPIQKIYRAICAAIRNNGAVQAASLKYTYLQQMIEEAGEAVYQRLPKYYDLGGEDIHGNYTADKQTADDTFSIIERLNLSARQMQILQLRLKGYGYKAIASYLGIKQGTVQYYLKAIQEKAEKINLTPATKKA